MKSLDDDPVWMHVRRVIERDWIMRTGVYVIFGTFATLAFDLRSWFVGGALVASLVTILTWVKVTGELSRLRRLVRRAVTQMPKQDGFVVVRGTVAAVETPVLEPQSRTTGAAAWSRTLASTTDGEVTQNEVAGATQFVLQCGDNLVVIDGSSAEVLADPFQANTGREYLGGDIREWLVAAVGDPVIVAGVLSSGPEAHPHRRAAQITAPPGHKVTIGLIGNVRDKRANR